ncbi:winged helix-turn-helix domain-containing protein [Streptomyces sp. 7-21]|jgi:hypothetical protein|uniref:winged helix-turn-helix domain-containing protein n=1 Tax=Streptomyces sp. 7-21 TaxID=2802283 RepID=UPI00191CC4FA|nr:winged helix-turn-helix domain-containing protein [Streptomyces sp. 7-21]MBL1067031.1 winged helix-turn-helix transcriptional regulator [Streptomyces sp. 7-21]
MRQRAVLRPLSALPGRPGRPAPSGTPSLTVTLAPRAGTGQDGGGSTVPLLGYVVVPPGAAAAAAGTRGPLRAVEGDAGLVIDETQRTAEIEGRSLDLTYLEFELLAHLARHPRRVYSREHLVTHVWGYEAVGDKRTVDVHVARLRRKLGPRHRNRIATVRGVGYRYVPAA